MADDLKKSSIVKSLTIPICLWDFFWTRVGSPTGEADSGTLEEIERVASAGKPVMLYFSQVKQDPELIDLQQLEKLREFKKKAFPKALVEKYTTQLEFRDKLAKQLEIQVRTLLAEEAQGGDLAAAPVTDIQLAFANPKDGSLIGDKLDLKINVLDLSGEDVLPDFVDPDESKSAISLENLGILGSSRNKDYYREMASYLRRRSFLRPVRFWLKNIGAVGARDVYVDFRIEGDNSDVAVLSPKQARLSPPSQITGIWNTGFSDGYGDIDLERVNEYWRASLELRALQPQRNVSPPIAFFVGAAKSGKITTTARIYADTLAQPITRILTINLDVMHTQKTALDVLKEADVEMSNFGKHKRRAS